MEANEIQIGDWVKVFDIDHPVKVAGIDAEYEGDVWVKIQDGATVYSESLVNIEPIPLTDEILMKNSISTSKKTFGVVYCLTEDEFNEVYVQLRTDSIWRVRIEHLKGNFINLIYVCTVHELQHVLRLRGIEKEIEL